MAAVEIPDNQAYNAQAAVRQCVDVQEEAERWPGAGKELPSPLFR